MDQNDANAPDSWETMADTENTGTDELSVNFNNLNVNAKPFVPNVHAAEFVPNFGVKSTPQEVNSADVSSWSSSTSSGNNDDGVVNKTSETENKQVEGSKMAVGEEAPAQEEGQIEEEEEEEEDMETDLAEPKGKKKEDEDETTKEHVNIVFIGHVDAGKSTIGGHVMYLTGQVDKRTLEKYEREAKEKNRETWYLSWALDTNQEERDKGKTVEVGRATFDTPNKHFTLLDAPGHKSFVPNMITGTAQADIGVLVISARKGEFETGFERGGQTREHAMLAKTAGVKHLVVLINKMDDPTVEWSEERYEECKVKLLPFLKKVGFNPKVDIYFMPCSGLTGANIKEPIDPSYCKWYSGPTFLSYIDELPALNRPYEGPIRLPISDKYKEMGTVVMGKLESGTLARGQSLVLMPNKVNVEVLGLMIDDDDKISAKCGENIKVKLKGVEEEDLSPGFVLCSPDSLCHTVTTFDAQIVILEHKSIICAGYSAVLHIHTVVEEVTLVAIKALIDKKTGKAAEQKPRFIKQDQTAIARFKSEDKICIETFQDFPQMGRFTLRDEGKTIAIGKVVKLRD